MKNLKRREDFIKENLNANGIWHMQTKDVKDIMFRHGKENENPLETIPEFDKGKHWSIDSGANFKSDEIEDLNEIYREDPDDDSFVLIPKKDVIKVWFVSYDEDSTFKPRRITKNHPFTY